MKSDLVSENSRLYLIVGAGITALVERGLCSNIAKGDVYFMRLSEYFQLSPDEFDAILHDMVQRGVLIRVGDSFTVRNYWYAGVSVG